MSDQREPLKILVFSASLRAESLNTRLARLAVDAIERHGATADLGSMRDFDAPSYDGDVEASDGMPPGPQAFRERLEAAHGFVIASPGVQGSMPGALKNAIDWISRARPQPVRLSRHVLPRPSPQRARRDRPHRRPTAPGTPRGHHRQVPGLVEASTHYPCVKRAWVDFLGEPPDPAVDRVDN